MYNDEMNQKAQAEKAYYAQAQTGCNLGGAVCADTAYRPSPAQEAERRAEHAYDEARKASEAASFLRQHPEFDEFIQLIRKGAIGI